jgi:aerobic carbon-monoxide dehydrogenase medium subunit
MKSRPFVYHRPSSITEALVMLDELDNPKIIAGGQTLVAMLNLRVSEIDNLVDLSELAELKKINIIGGYIEVGAMVTQTDLADHEILEKELPIFKFALSHVGHVQTRNRGTIGGSLCHLDPSAELPLLAIALGAEMIIRAPAKSRTISAEEFIEDMLTPSIEENEILTSIRIPIKTWNGWGFNEYARRHGDFAVVAIACFLNCDEQNVIEEIVLAAGGLCEVPFRLKKLENQIIGHNLNELNLDELIPKAFNFNALDDPMVPAWYRKHIACEGIKNAITQAYKVRLLSGSING